MDGERQKREKDKMIMKPKKKNYSLMLDGEVAEQIRTLAERQDRSLSQYINRLLKKRLQAVAKEERNGAHLTS